MFNSQKAKSIALRFAKAFVAGGLAAVTAMSIAVPHSISDTKQLALVMVSAFVSGGLMAVEKAWNWQDVIEVVSTTETQTPVV